MKPKVADKFPWHQIYKIYYVFIYYCYYYILYNSSITDIELSPNYIALGLPQTTEWISDNQQCYNVYIYIYIYI